MALATSVSRQIALVLKQIGSDITYIEPQANAYDPATGKVTSASGATHVVPGALMNVTERAWPKDTVLMSDREVLIQPQDGWEPKPGGIVRVGAEDWTVMQVQNSMLNGVVLLYTCQVRKGP
jgi:hypothetical protein